MSGWRWTKKRKIIVSVVGIVVLLVVIGNLAGGGDVKPAVQPAAPASPTVRGLVSAATGVEATRGEIREACRALSIYRYDYWRLDDATYLDTRELVAAAAINEIHPGPRQTQGYCLDNLADYLKEP